MYFVYIIRSINTPYQIYVGKTTNLKKRLSDHNCGTTAHTEKYKPWEVVFYAAFIDELKAIEFEKYLKSGSGREFRQKRLV
jgi:predicted GIY-YIG superfamily endonuclease